jgi:sugar phosphate isomerase/epimerase
MLQARQGKKINNPGLQAWSLAKYFAGDLEGTLKMVADNGYKELELFGPYPFSSEKDKADWDAIAKMVGFAKTGYFGLKAKEFKKVLDKYGLKTPAMHVGLNTLRNNMGELAEAAHELGQSYAGIAAIPAEERKTLDDYKRIADDFNKIGENANKHGIKFYYHNHGYGLKPVDGVVPFDLILQRTDPSLVFLEMDVYWTAAGGADPIKYLDNNKGRFMLMHLKDMKKQMSFSGDGGDPSQWMELFPNITDAGTGVLDLKNIVIHAQRSGMEHFIIENDVVKDPAASLKNGAEFLASI